MKRICVITGSRADYGLLRWVIQGLHESDKCELQIVATGMHLSTEFGSTWQTIEDDGYSIDWRVDMLLSADTAIAITKSMGVALVGFADAFSRLKPDAVIVLGDRFEILSAVSAAMIACIPIIHLHGGEITEGAFDDPIRHAITKMSHLHFTASEPYRQRVIQMGEAPDRVWNVGGFGIDNVKRLKRMELGELEASLGFSLGERSLLVTFHPETATGVSPKVQMLELLAALEQTEAQLLFTMPNADTDSRILFSMVEDFVREHPMRACAFTSLGQHRYLSAVAHTDGVVGNSSSGLIEVPALGKGTINIGSRQNGRLRASSIIDCDASKASISKALDRLYSSGFQASLKNVDAPYGDGGASERAVSLIESYSLESVPKKFFDLSFHAIGK